MTVVRLRGLPAALLLAFTPLAASMAAGMDCTQARTPTEKALCADAGLHQLDAELGAVDVYKRQFHR